MDYYQAPLIPSAFIWRRAHSLSGLWLVLFLIEHLIVNSQAALFIGDDGSGFVTAVNSIKDLPYLPVIEIFLLGMPLFIHGVWGIKYLLTSESNSLPTDGSTVSLPQFARNHAYTWQRITSWILLFGIVAHVIHMRIIQYPESAQLGAHHYYMSRLNTDNGLYTLSRRLGVDLYDKNQIQQMNEQMTKQSMAFEHSTVNDPNHLIAVQKSQETKAWLNAIEKRPLNENQVIAVSNSFGVAELLMVRDSFKDPIIILLYTGLVLAACFHAFNGLWTFLITWGISLTARSQKLMRKIAVSLMILITFLGLSAIWGTYWLNLNH